MKIVAFEIGYIDMSNAVLLAQNLRVKALDLYPVWVKMVKSRKNPIEDAVIERSLTTDTLDLIATTDPTASYATADVDDKLFVRDRFGNG